MPLREPTGLLYLFRASPALCCRAIEAPRMYISNLCLHPHVTAESAPISQSFSYSFIWLCPLCAPRLPTHTSYIRLTLSAIFGPDVSDISFSCPTYQIRLIALDLQPAHILSRSDTCLLPQAYQPHPPSILPSLSSTPSPFPPAICPFTRCSSSVPCPPVPCAASWAHRCSWSCAPACAPPASSPPPRQWAPWPPPAAASPRGRRRTAPGPRDTGTPAVRPPCRCTAPARTAARLQRWEGHE